MSNKGNLNLPTDKVRSESTKELSYKRYIFRQKAVPYAFLAPNLIIFITFIIIPALIGVYYSFTEFDGLHDPVWVGLANYKALFTDEYFGPALWNTIKYVAATVPLIFAVSLGLAVLLVQPLKGKWFFRASYYWPVMISAVVVGIMWQWILGDSFGFVNVVLGFFGVGPIETLTNGTFAWWAVVFAMVWSRAGYYMVMFMGALLSIPESLYEAANIDGANKWQQFWSITYPILRPARVMVIILSTMAVFKVYPLVVTLTDGGPYSATTFLVQHVYEVAFESYKIGFASSMSMVMLLIVTIFSGVNFFMSRSGE